ncbi:TetR/AcrR family transcriptional regulator [Sphingobium estronivorans]|uniref:TetR/AcrR family transcriptional regulator n=1 Tax=Sphingobium estronivorans TaxID=1577690 RepID=UPI0013C2FEFC|nr:TetR/AcrR family transcriptional regulator [Sphingobium estronivorans]
MKKQGETAPSGDAVPQKKRVGRPQDEERGEAILTVTLDIMGERGYAGLTVAEIVARARVSKSTIYRRWPTKEELAIAAFDRLPELEVMDRGDLLEELLDLIGQYQRVLQSTPLGSVLPGLVSEAAHNPALAQALRATIDRRRQPTKAALRRAVGRGELPPYTDVDQADEIIMAPLLQRSFYAMEQDMLDDFRQMLTIILAGLRSPAARPPLAEAKARGRGAA